MKARTRPTVVGDADVGISDVRTVSLSMLRLSTVRLKSGNDTTRTHPPNVGVDADLSVSDVNDCFVVHVAVVSGKQRWR